MKTYKGTRLKDGGCSVEVHDGDRKYPLPLYLDVRNHSPTGFEWGYGGSGPAQLALAMMMDHAGAPLTLNANTGDYQQFKFDVIAKLPQADSWTITSDEIDRWLKDRKQ